MSFRASVIYFSWQVLSLSRMPALNSETLPQRTMENQFSLDRRSSFNYILDLENNRPQISRAKILMRLQYFPMAIVNSFEFEQKTRKTRGRRKRR